MESNIILEKFRMAEQQHGMWYIKFIGDGDSSIHAQIIAGVSGCRSKNAPITLLKCFKSSLAKLAKDNPQHKGRGKLTEQMQKRLESSIRCATVNRSKLPDKMAARLLQKDILNVHCIASVVTTTTVVLTTVL